MIERDQCFSEKVEGEESYLMKQLLIRKSKEGRSAGVSGRLTIVRLLQDKLKGKLVEMDEMTVGFRLRIGLFQGLVKSL